MSLPVLLLAIILSGVPWCAVGVPADHGDAAAMQAIATSVRAPKSLGWGVSSDPCDGTWAGVRCNEVGRVTSIIASRVGLAGMLYGSDLSKLMFLSNLDLSFNGLDDDLPILPTPLQQLRTIDLSSNSFFNLRDGFFSGLPALETFVLDNNRMIASFYPKDILTCSGLRIFSANNVSIEDIFPHFFGNASLFPVLERLLLARNRIWGDIHQGFGDGSEIKYLDTSGQNDPRSSDHKLSGRLDLFIPGMTSLVEAHLDHNAFFGPLPDATQLVNLRRSLRCCLQRPMWEAQFAPGTVVNLGNPKVGNGCSH